MSTPIEIRTERNVWIFSALGGRLAGWSALDATGPEPVFRVVCKGDPAAKPSADAHRAIVMFPWVNRIGGDHWTLEGERVPLDLSGPLTHLHGRIYDLPWETVETSAERVVFRRVVEPHEFYPRRIECRIEYSLARGDASTGTAEGLEVAMVARNLEADRAAFCTMGVHPYFANPYGGTVDAATLECPAEREFLVDDRLIPTGLSEVLPEHDFRVPRTIGSTRLDNGFVVRADAATLARLSLDRFALTIRPVENCRYAQIYIPPHREEIAIEPQSGGADAFRVPEYGLRALRAGESFRFATRFEATFA